MFKHFLRDDKPAQKWVQSYPIGNGNIGVMETQNPLSDTIYFNDDTFWSGYGQDKHNTCTAEKFAEIKKATLNKQFATAERLIAENILGGWTENYLPVGELSIQTGITDYSDYERVLNMDSALLSYGLNTKNGRISSESFVSFPNKVYVKKITAKSALTSKISFTVPKDIKGGIEFATNALYTTLLAPTTVAPIYHDFDTPIVYDDSHPGLSLIAATRFLTDGILTYNSGEVTITNYTTLTLLYTSKTSYNFTKDIKQYCDAILNDAETLGYDKLLAAHLADYTKLFGRVSLSINGATESPANTENSLKTFKSLPDDSLVATLFAFGRYLTIAASREGTQATNLQGIWNNIVRAPWCSNYTTNINTEMNYFGTDIVNLSECIEPLYNLMQKCSIRGATVAKNTFGMRGWVLAHNTDLWGQANPVGQASGAGACVYGLFIGASGWILHHLFEHYLFTNDKAFLAELYPYIEQSAAFYLDYLSKDEKGKLIPNPTASPENCYMYRFKPYAVTSASTMELSIIRTTLQSYLKAAKILGGTALYKDAAVNAIANLKDYTITKHGRIGEWNGDYREQAPHHRHVSHLYGLYPQYEITPEKTPLLARAAVKSLKRRGLGGTGWSLAWKINMYARLKDGETAYKLIKNQLTYIPADDKIVMAGGGSYSSLLCAHPPFQIDGNFGAMAGIAEMLLQSHGDCIQLLPAIPKSWQSGKVIGLKARGNLTVNITWADGKVTDYNISAPQKTQIQVKVNGKLEQLSI